MRSRIGRPATPQHRLGHRVGQRPQPRALAAGHDHGPVVARDRGSRNAWSRWSADRPAGVVEDRDRVDLPGTHQVQGVGPGLAGREGDEVGVEARPRAGLEGGATRAARGGGRRRWPCRRGGRRASTASAIPAGAPVERGQGVADRARTARRWDPASGSATLGAARRAGTPDRRCAVRRRPPTTTAPIADRRRRSPTTTWSRTAAPSPTSVRRRSAATADDRRAARHAAKSPTATSCSTTARAVDDRVAADAWRQC